MTVLEIILSVLIVLILLSYRKLYGKSKRAERSLKIAGQIKKNLNVSFEMYAKRQNNRYDALEKRHVEETEKLTAKLQYAEAKLVEYETNADEELADLIKESGYAV